MWQGESVTSPLCESEWIDERDETQLLQLSLWLHLKSGIE